MEEEYPKQPYNPDRKPEESVTWVRVWEKLKKRKLIVGTGKNKVYIKKVGKK